jgi:hypothetical protein
LDEEGLRNLHRNCLLKLDDVKRGREAAALLKLIHAELSRRAKDDRDDQGFLPLLRCVGYNVHWHGLGLAERRRLLDWLLESELPQINDAEYVASWGDPGSNKRRQRLIETIQLYRRRYGPGPGMENALIRWDADLAYLRSAEQ